MQRCKKCYMPDTRPGTNFRNGMCDACRNMKEIGDIDWYKRLGTIEELCSNYRHSDGSYDCVIPVSGGKNSHVQVKTIKECHMNPLLVTVCDPFTKSKAGQHNASNLGKTFGCDHIFYHMKFDLFKQATRIGFEELGEPLRFIETMIYTYPYKLAKQLGINLVVYGESPYELGSYAESLWADDFIRGKSPPEEITWWKERGFTNRDLFNITLDEPDPVSDPRAIFLSWGMPWGSELHRSIASRYGFMDVYHEWQREGYIEHFEQIDSLAYIIHLWMKYPKFGFQRISDIVGKRIRYGDMTYDEGKRIVDANDSRIDRRALDDFCSTLGYTIPQFYAIVDKWYNTDIFEQDVFGVWRMKNGND